MVDDRVRLTEHFVVKIPELLSKVRVLFETNGGTGRELFELQNKSLLLNQFRLLDILICIMDI